MNQLSSDIQDGRLFFHAFKPVIDQPITELIELELRSDTEIEIRHSKSSGDESSSPRHIPGVAGHRILPDLDDVIGPSSKISLVQSHSATGRKKALGQAAESLLDTTVYATVGRQSQQHKKQTNGVERVERRDPCRSRPRPPSQPGAHLRRLKCLPPRQHLWSSSVLSRLGQAQLAVAAAAAVASRQQNNGTSGRSDMSEDEVRDAQAEIRQPQVSPAQVTTIAGTHGTIASTSTLKNAIVNPARLVFFPHSKLMHHPLLICAILSATVFCVSLAGVPLENFYRFGKDHGDKETVIGTDPDRVDLEPPFRIFGNERDYVYVYCNGAIVLFGGYIAPFAFDYYPSYYTGNTFYRQSTEEVDLDKARGEIGSAFPAFQDIDLKWVFISTWKQIGSTQHPNARNTFQAILTTDGVRSFVIFNYNETNKIAESTLAEFDLLEILNSTTSDYKRYKYLLEGSNTSEMLTINHRSNVYSPGKWVFRIDLATIKEPCPKSCPKPPQPVNGFCKSSEYVPDSEARCGCNLGFSTTFVDTLSIKCLLVSSSTYNWVGNIPVCRSLTQGDSLVSIKTQHMPGPSNNISASSHSSDIYPKVTCPPPPMPQNAICEKKAYVPGSAANCTCLPDHHLKNPSSNFYCSFAKDGSLFWHGEVPVCALNSDT